MERDLHEVERFHRSELAHLEQEMGFRAFLVLILIEVLCIIVIATHSDAYPTILLILLVPPMFLVLPLALQQAASELLILRKQFAWWHALWVLLFLSGLVFRTRDVESIRESPIDPWAAYRILLVAIVALVLVARLVLGKTPWLTWFFPGPAGAMALYILVSMASTLWSVYPAWTFYKSAELLVDYALLAAILTHTWGTAHFRSLFNCTWALCVACLGTIWIGVIMWPAEAVFHNVGSLGIQIQGVVPVISANGVGDLGAVVAVMAASRLQFKQSPALYSVAFAVSLATLILSQTRSAVIGFVVATILVLFIGGRIRPIACLALTAVLLLLASNAGDVLWTYLQRGQAPDVVRSLSGRTGWWTFALDKFAQRPLTGYGAYAGARFAALAEMGAIDTSSIHNTYIEVLLGTGILGIIPFLTALLMVWATLIKAVRNTHPGSLERQLITEAVGLLAFGTVRSVFTSALVWHPDVAFLQILGLATFLRQHAYQHLAYGTRPAFAASI